MKHLLFAIALLLSMSTSAFRSHETTNSEATQAATQSKTLIIQRFHRTPINGLSVGHTFQTTLKQGTQTGVTLQIDSRMEPYLTCKLDGGQLTLGFHNLPREFQNNNKWACQPTATITVSRLDHIEASGASQITPEGTFSGINSHIHTSGIGKINNLTLQTNGKAEITCSGASKLTNLNLSTPTSINAEISGTSAASLTCQTGTFAMEATGASHLTTSGTAHRVTIKASGTAGIDAEALKTKSASCDASGVASIRCWTTEELSATASGASSVRYRSDKPITLHANKSGVASISKL